MLAGPGPRFCDIFSAALLDITYPVPKMYLENFHQDNASHKNAISNWDRRPKRKIEEPKLALVSP